MNAPFGGFSPTGVSGGESSASSLPARVRNASRSAKSLGLCDSACELSSANSRSGNISSRIQKARPWVAIARSPLCTLMSRTDTTGMFKRNDCHDSASSNDT